MSCLVETHTEEEFDYHLENKTRIIGINNRNLKTFKTDINHTMELIKNKHLCKSFVISESGINSFEDILKLSNSGIAGILVGEFFMTSTNITDSIKGLCTGR
jgi:indole-3-glycerol phosphate synthase